MDPYPPEIERDMRAFYQSLHENDRRRYAAIEAEKLGHGGIEYVARLLDIDPKTIRRGRRELRDISDGPSSRIREPGGGRKRRIDTDPKLKEDFQAVLAEHTAGSPVQEEIIWTDLTPVEIAEHLHERGSDVSVHIVGQLLDQAGFHDRKPLRMCRMADCPDRNAQFEVIAGLKQTYLASADPILSMDLKARELIGNFCRAGSFYSKRTVKTFDHSYEQFADGVALPHGLYDLKLNRGYVHVGTSHDTSEFACDSLLDWWNRFGRVQYPEAKSLLLLCDGGGSNPADTARAEQHLFRWDMQRLADALGFEVRLAHYPPYTSKYNPIEHRLFPHLSRVCRGVVFTSLDRVVGLMRKASTRTGLSVVVDVLDKLYETGRKLTDAAKEAIHVIRDAILPRWNYRILPSS
ncbi:MAG: ISAzo13 family transposase [Solirubrobacterales bacterium]|nr:ISAzo13 family transposase [Solirubrobacterales bacterium]